MIDMNEEEFNRKMAFIVEQQAQFDLGIQRLREAHEQTENVVARLAYATLEGFKDVNTKIDALVDGQIRLDESQAKLTESQAKLTESQAKLTESQAKLTESQAELTESQAELTESQAQLTESQAELTESQAQLTESQLRTDRNLGRTDEALRRLIANVDRYLREGRNSR